MKKLRCFLCLTFLLLPALAMAADPQRLAAVSRISAVTVYPDRALTTRTAALNLQPGSYLVVFEGLPALIQEDSVRIAGKGSAGATIAGLEIKRTFLAQSAEERVRAIEAEIRALEQRCGTLEAKKAGLEAQGAFIESIRTAWGERISGELAIGRPSAAELQEAAGFVGSGVAAVEEQIFAIETEKKGLQEKIEALRRQRQDAAGAQVKETKDIEVLVAVAREGSLTLELSAVVPRAGWLPVYDARLAADGKNAEFAFRALVRQQTGEDWHNVDLTLSTARPATGGAPPEIAPWHIALFRPQPAREAMLAYAAPAPLMEMSSAGARRADIADEEVAADLETAEFGEEQAAVTFHLPRPLDVPSDGSPHNSVVAVEQLPVALEFVAVPKLSPYVFRKSEIVNRAAYPLLPGKVNTFAGNTFTGSAQLPKIAAGETFDLFFGADEQVTVKREELKQQKEGGVFGKNRVTYRCRFELNNYHREPVTLALVDQLPLAADEEIAVVLDSPSSQPDTVAADGRLTWKTLLQPGEKKELGFGIVVEYPKEHTISGL